MKQITNKEFTEAYENIDNISIIRTVKSKFKKYIPKQELTRCGMIGLWKALQYYNPDKNTKFTSFLYTIVSQECFRWIRTDIKENKKKSITSSLSDIEHSEEIPSYNEFDDLVSTLSPSLADIVKLRIINNMSLKEIGKVKKFSHETARRKLTEAFSIIKNANPVMS